MSLDVNRMIMVINRGFFSLSHNMRSKIISRKTKILIYKIFILPILMYDSVSWIMDTSEETIYCREEIIWLIFSRWGMKDMVHSQTVPAVQ